MKPRQRGQTEMIRPVTTDRSVQDRISVKMVNVQASVSNAHHRVNTVMEMVAVYTLDSDMWLGIVLAK